MQNTQTGRATRVIIRPRPLYTEHDARRAMCLLKTCRFDEEQVLADGLRLKFLRAGHILGASIVQFYQA